MCVNVFEGMWNMYYYTCAIFGISSPIPREEERAIKKGPSLKRSGKKSPRRRREVSLAGRTHSKWLPILGNVFSLVMMARAK